MSHGLGSASTVNASTPATIPAGPAPVVSDFGDTDPRRDAASDAPTPSTAPESDKSDTGTGTNPLLITPAFLGELVGGHSERVLQSVETVVRELPVVSELGTAVVNAEAVEGGGDVPVVAPNTGGGDWKPFPGPPHETRELLRTNGPAALRATRPPTIGGPDSRIPRFGVTSRLLQELLGAIPETATTADVCAQLVLTATAPTTCAFTELLWDRLASPALKAKPLDNRRGRLATFLGEADVFVSHAWSMPFRVLAETVAQHDAHADKSDCFGMTTYYWLDIFSVNQHSTTIGHKSPEWWAGTFSQAIAEIGTVLLVTSPWDRPVPLKRAWCLWEVYSAIKGKCTVHMESPALDVTHLETALTQAGGFDAALDARASVSMQEAECTFSSDRDRIFSVIRDSEFGFDGVDTMVRGRLLGQLLCLGARAAELKGTLACLAAGASAMAGSVEAPSSESQGRTAKPKKSMLFSRKARQVSKSVVPFGSENRWRAGAIAVAVRLATMATTATPLRVSFAEYFLGALVADQGTPSGANRLTAMLEVSDSHGMRALHWACIGEAKEALSLAQSLVLAGASIAAGRTADGATPLALLPAGQAQSTIALAIVKSTHTAPLIREAAEQFLATTSKRARREQGALAAFLLPVVARQALSEGLHIGNTSKELTDKRLACRAYVRAASGVPLSAFVEKVTYTILRGSEDTELSEALVPRHEPPFDWDCFLWGYFDTTVTVHWKPETKLGEPVVHVHGIVWHDSEVHPSDRDTFAIVEVPF